MVYNRLDTYLQFTFVSSAIIGLITSALVPFLTTSGYLDSFINIAFYLSYFYLFIIILLVLLSFIESDDKNPITHAIWTKINIKLNEDRVIKGHIVFVLLVYGGISMFAPVLGSVILYGANIGLINYLNSAYKTDLEKVLK